MGELAAKTLAFLRIAQTTGVLNDDVEWAITVAADLLAKLGNPRYQSGLPEVDAAEVTEADGQQLKQTLFGLLKRHPESRLAGSLIWALGKTADPAYAGEFVAQLERGLGMLLEGNGLVFQTLCSLDNLGEAVFERDGEGGSSQSLTEVERNIRQAKAYLAKRGVQLPW